MLESALQYASMGWPVFGNEKTVAAFSRDDLARYMGANYRAGSMMLIASGAVTEDFYYRSLAAETEPARRRKSSTSALYSSGASK